MRVVGAGPARIRAPFGAPRRAAARAPRDPLAWLANATVARAEKATRVAGPPARREGRVAVPPRAVGPTGGASSPPRDGGVAPVERLVARFAPRRTGGPFTRAGRAGVIRADDPVGVNPWDINPSPRAPHAPTGGVGRPPRLEPHKPYKEDGGHGPPKAPARAYARLGAPIRPPV